MSDQIVSTGNSLWAGLTAGFTAFMGFIPALIGGLVVLAIGWIVASAIGKLVEKALHALRFEHAFHHSKVGSYLPQRTPALSASNIVGKLAKWFVMLIFIQAVANIWNMPQVTAVISSIILFLPNLFVAMLFLVGGAVLARFVGNIVESSLSRAQGVSPRVFSLITRYAILGFALIAAVNQLGIATNLINILFTGLVASLALAFGLAFGLGGQSVAGELTRGWYDRSVGGGARLRAVAGGALPSGMTTGGAEAGAPAGRGADRGGVATPEGR